MTNNINKDDFQPFDFQIRNKEIDLLQSVINRMAENQLKVKGFCVTLVGLIATIATKQDVNLIILACSVIANFIIIYKCYKLDFNFLKTEKLYRMWFDFILEKRSESKAYLFVLNPSEIKRILNNQQPQDIKYNPLNIEKETRKSWAFGFYWIPVLIVAIIYLPTCFAASSAHFPILLTIMS
jgi:hypothetical protein